MSPSGQKYPMGHNPDGGLGVISEPLQAYPASHSVQMMADLLLYRPAGHGKGTEPFMLV